VDSLDARVRFFVVAMLQSLAFAFARSIAALARRSRSKASGVFALSSLCALINFTDIGVTGVEVALSTHHGLFRMDSL
jgi:hypothetical protein